MERRMAQSRQAVAAASENGARDVYAANCNHGPSVAPEYRFFLRDEATGAETPLTDCRPRAFSPATRAR